MKTTLSIKRFFILISLSLLISNLYSQTCPSNIIAYWKLEEVGDTTLSDFIGDNDATGPVALTNDASGVDRGSPSAAPIQAPVARCARLLRVRSTHTRCPPDPGRLAQQLASSAGQIASPAALLSDRSLPRAEAPLVQPAVPPETRAPVRWRGNCPLLD